MRIRGSHHVYAKAGTAIRISVPVHGNVPLKIRLAAADHEVRRY